jgi:ABC-type enterochelin transport system ATPase subunit
MRRLSTVESYCCVLDNKEPDGPIRKTAAEKTNLIKLTNGTLRALSGTQPKKKRVSSFVFRSCDVLETDLPLNEKDRKMVFRYSVT